MAVLTSKRAIALAKILVLLSLVSGCANSQSGKNLEQILAADPRQGDITTPVATGTNTNAVNGLQLPADFPPEIPRYPNAQLQQVTQSQTRWTSPDPSNLVQSFYRNQLQAWDLSQPTEQQGSTLTARRDDLQITVTVQPVSATSNVVNPVAANQSPAASNADIATEIIIQYTRDSETATSQTDSTEIPQPGAADFIGPLPQSATTTAQSSQTTTPASGGPSSDISAAPAELRPYIQDLTALGVLPLEADNTKSSQSSNSTAFEPSKIITRREYARWLATVNNRLYTNTPAKQIRAAASTNQPAFQDVPASDPDFAVIQGLAEAGLIPSSLSGSSTTVLFRPDAPLTREQLILWKVPLDTRQALPSASIDAVKQTWGFQDAAKIEPRALQAVLADFQNGENSNIRRVFGYTTLFQPQKAVTRAEAAAALWYFGTASEGVSAQEALKLNTQPSPAATPTSTVEGVNQPSSSNDAGSTSP